MINKALKKRILTLCPSEELKEALNANNYEYALAITQEIKGMICVYESPFSLFSDIYECIQAEDIALFSKIITFCCTTSMLDAISTILETSAIMEDEERRKNLPLNEQRYFASLQLLNRYEELQMLDEISAFSALISLKGKRYNKVRSMATVFNIPLAEDLTSAYQALAEYIEALIYSNEITPEDITRSLLNKDLDTLMEKIKVLAYLKKTYSELKAEEIEQIKEEARAKIDTIEEIGFPRT
ncbi:MAG: hypothetical protein K2J20_00285 [Bacilli bacterium]|nr:hypothetical protein [Bacilli bacterium]